MENTRLSELDSVSKLDFKNLALDHKIKYKKKLNFSDDMQFGIEIEAICSDFIRTMNKKKFMFYFSDFETEPDNVYDYNMWILNHESSLRLENGDSIYPNMELLYNNLMCGNINYREFDRQKKSLMVVRLYHQFYMIIIGVGEGFLKCLNI